jgi:hypothetical protein
MKNEKERRAKSEGYPDRLVGQHGGEPGLVPLVGERGVDVRLAAAARATHTPTHTRVDVRRVVSCRCCVVSCRCCVVSCRGLRRGRGAYRRLWVPLVKQTMLSSRSMFTRLRSRPIFIDLTPLCRVSCQFVIVISFDKHKSCFVSFRFVPFRWRSYLPCSFPPWLELHHPPHNTLYTLTSSL